MSKVQGPMKEIKDTSTTAAEVEMPEMRQGRDAEAKGEVRLAMHSMAGLVRVGPMRIG